MNIIPLRYFSYTRAEKDATCKMQRYLSTEWGGTGMDAVDTGWDRLFGNVQHGFLQTLALTGTIDYVKVRETVLKACQDVGLNHISARDWAAISEGQLRGFVRHIWPHWMAEYDIIETEKLRAWECAPGYIFRYRQDILLRNKYDGHIRYPDYKTTGSDDPKWIASWAKSPQLHSSMYAIKQQGVDVQHSIVPGLYKGYRDRKTGVQRSIFAYGWVNREYVTVPEYSYEYKRGKGWELFSTFEEFPDLDQWIAKMPSEILSAQFPTTGPIFLNEKIGETYFRQQLIREKDVAEGMFLLETAPSVEAIQAILDRYFPQSFSKCDPAYGFKCDYMPYCWQPWVEADPLGSKLFVRRNTDHETEVIG